MNAPDPAADGSAGSPPSPPLADDPPTGLVTASWVGTVALAVTAIPAAALQGPLVGVSAVVSLVMFLVGTLAFLAAYVRAIGRSRTDAIGIGGLFFLVGSAPARVRRQMMASLAVEVVVGLGVASARVYSAMAFAVLAPMYGLGLAGLWGARHGSFAPRRPAPPDGDGRVAPDDDGDGDAGDDGGG